MATVIITSLSEHRTDGAVWVTGTVDGAAWNYRWTKPLDIVPGGLAVAQAFANEYNSVNTLLTTWFLGKTVTINTPGGPTFTVVFSGTKASMFANPCAGQIQLMATVNGSPGSYICNVSTAEFLGWNVAGRNLGQVIADRIAKSYVASTSTLLPYIATFSNVTPQIMSEDGEVFEIDEQAQRRLEEKQGRFADQAEEERRGAADRNENTAWRTQKEQKNPEQGKEPLQGPTTTRNLPETQHA